MAGSYQRALLERFAGVGDAVVVEVAVDSGANGAAACKPLPRKSESVARIEREVEIEADCERAVGRRLAGYRQSEPAEPADVADPHARAMLRPVVGERAFPIGVVGRRPIAGQLRGAEPAFRADLECRRAADPYRADSPGADEARDNVWWRRRPLGQILLGVSRLNLPIWAASRAAASS